MENKSRALHLLERKVHERLKKQKKTNKRLFSIFHIVTINRNVRPQWLSYECGNRTICQKNPLSGSC